MRRRMMFGALRAVLTIQTLCLLPLVGQDAGHAQRPNIVWIISEDMGPDLGCWDVKVHTPNIDSLARDGVRYLNVFGTASVCMPNRTAMITGVTQTTLGSVTMRPPAEFRRPLAGGVKPLPGVLRELGYFSGNIKDGRIGSGGKDDWNFSHDGKGWDTHRLADLKPHQPFYAQFNFKMAHRPFKQDAEHPIDPGTVELPPYYPDHPVARRSWSDYLESIQHLDRNVGRVMAWLQREGLADNTIVFFLSDHGEAFLRGKYFLYDCSLNQPLIIRWPEGCNPPPGFTPGTANHELLAAIDMTAQTVACAGGTVPGWMHGRAFLDPRSRARSEVFSAADWIGGNRLKSRSIRTTRYKYIRNFNTALSVNSASTEYRKAKHPMYHLVQLLAERGELEPLHRKLLLDPLPGEELYDLRKDPHELSNLAADPTLAKVKRELRERVETWIKESGDLGFEPLHPEHVAFFDAYRAGNERKYRTEYGATRARVRKAIEDHTAFLGAAPEPVATASLRIDAGHPGGNIVVERIQGDAVYLHQDLRDTKGWWFYWGFRVRDAGARTLTFHFTNRNVIGVRGPAVSRDAGASWHWLGADAARATEDGVRFSYTFRAENDDVRFCFAMPYQRADLDRFLKRHAHNAHVRVETLCTTRANRSNVCLHVGNLGPTPAHRVLIACRHHACESMASYALEGFLDTVLGPTETGRWLRNHVEIMAVPLVDLDGVEQGDQGKNRRPRDHNRDYDGTSVHPTVRAIRELVPGWADGRLAVAIDIHCPHIRGKHNEVIYQVGSDSPAIWTQQGAFAAVLASCATGPLPYRASDNLPFGQAWNTSANYGAGASFLHWAQSLPGVRLTVPLELPYANAGGQPVTAESARAFGADLARALAQYLQAEPSPPGEREPPE